MNIMKRTLFVSTFFLIVLWAAGGFAQPTTNFNNTTATVNTTVGTPFTITVTGTISYAGVAFFGCSGSGPQFYKMVTITNLPAGWSITNVTSTPALGGWSANSYLSGQLGFVEEFTDCSGVPDYLDYWATATASCPASNTETITITITVMPTSAATVTLQPYVIPYCDCAWQGNLVTSRLCAPLVTNPPNVVVTAGGPTPGVIAASQTICQGSDPAAFTSTTAASGGTGTLVYTWQSGPSATGPWTDLPGSNSTTFDIGVVNTPGTVHYRRQVKDNNGTGTAFFSNVISITTNATTATASAGADQLGLCTATATLSPSPAGGTWSVVSQPGGASASLSGNNVSNMTVAGDYTFRYTIAGTAPCPNSTDDVLLRVNPVPASNAGSDQTICNTASSATLSPTATNGTGTWSVVTAPGGATVTFAGNTANGLTVNGAYTLRYTVAPTSGSCANATDDVVITRVAPATANAGSDQLGLCANTATLSPSPAGGSWTVVSQPGGASATVSGNNVSGMTVTGNYTFRYSVTTSPCAPSTDDVLISVTSVTQANAGTRLPVCIGDVPTSPLSANSPAVGETATWSVTTVPSGANAATIGFSPGASTPGATPTGITVAGTYVFTWTISRPGCTSTTDTYIYEVDGNPTTANAGADVKVCNVATATVTAVAPANGTWSFVSGPATASISTSGTTGSITGMTAAGDYVFQWAGPSNACGTSSDLVTVTREAPVPGTVTTPGTAPNVCLPAGGASVTLTGNTAPSADIIGTWTLTSAPAGYNLASVTYTPNANTPNAVAGNLTAVGTYNWEWVFSRPGGTCPPSGPAGFKFTVDAPPTTAVAISDQVTCLNTITLTGNTPTNGFANWSFVSGPSAATITTSGTTGTVSGMSAIGDYIFRYTISSGGCTPSTDDVKVTRGNNPTSVAGPAPADFCGTSVVLSPTATNGTGTWETVTVPAGYTLSATGNTINNLIPGSYTLRYRVSAPSCIDAVDNVSFNVLSPPTANAGNNANICSSSTSYTLSPTPATGGTWSVVSQPVGANATFAGNDVNGLTVNGAYTFRYTVAGSGTGCGTATSDVTITLTTTPTASAGTAPASTCNSSVTLSPTPSTGGTWDVVSAPAGYVLSNTGNTINGLIAGNYTLRYSVTSLGCPAATGDVSFTILAQPTADAGLANSICSTTNTAGLSPTPSTGGTWSVVSQPAGASASFSGNNANGLTVNGAYTFRYTVPASGAGCSPATDDVTITRVAAPTANAGANINNICGTSTPLSPSPAGGTWSVVTQPAGASVTFSGNTANGLTAGGSYTLRYTVNGTAPCAPATDDVVVTKEAGTASFILSNTQLILPAPNVLSVANTSNVPAGSTYSWTFAGGTPSTWNTASPPAITYTAPGFYPVTLTIISPNGCTYVAPTQTVEVRQLAPLRMPSAFSPNNDGLNDVFAYDPTGFNTISMRVYDRWGVLVFETNSLSQFWNGRKNNDGDALPEGVYVYQLIAVDINNETIEKKGTITLIR